MHVYVCVCVCMPFPMLPATLAKDAVHYGHLWYYDTLKVLILRLV